MDDALGVDISQGTTQLGDPKSNRFLREAFSGDVEPQITAVHEIDHDITGLIISDHDGLSNGPRSVTVTYIYSIS
jgi:hypothetical protein